MLFQNPTGPGFEIRARSSFKDTIVLTTVNVRALTSTSDQTRPHKFRPPQASMKRQMDGDREICWVTTAFQKDARTPLERLFTVRAIPVVALGAGVFDVLRSLA